MFAGETCRDARAVTCFPAASFRPRSFINRPGNPASKYTTMHVSRTVFSSTFGRLAAAAFLLGVAARTTSADVVTDWNATYEAAVRNPTPGPPVLARSAAIVHSAIFDAVNGIAKKYTPVRVTDAAPAGARAEAAAAQAAYTTLLSLFPSKQSLLDAQLAASLAQLTSAGATAQSVTIGRAWGENVAQQILAWRATDGFSQVLTYPGSTAAGYWRHAPLGAAPVGGLSLTVTIPFALTNLAAFDPGPPYGLADRAAAMATAAYAADVNEVQARGGTVSAGSSTAAHAVLPAAQAVLPAPQAGHRMAHRVHDLGAHRESLARLLLDRVLADAEPARNFFLAQAVHPLQDEDAAALQREFLHGAAEREESLLRFEVDLHRDALDLHVRIQLVQAAYTVRELVVR